MNLRLLTTLMFKQFICFAGWIFYILSVSPQLREQSEILQALLAFFTSAQGVLVFAYCICSNSEAQTFWTPRKWCFRPTALKISHLFATNTDLKDANSAIREPKHFTSLFHGTTKAVASGGKGNKVIATDTNPAYEMVVLHNKKNKYTITPNEAYAHIGRFRMVDTD